MLRRWLGFPALILYSALLAVAALVPEIRPGPLDRPWGFAYSLLKTVGVMPGIPLFQNQHGDDEKWRAQCIKVRADGPGGARADLFPPDLVCQKSGLRLSMPPIEHGIFHMLEQAWSYELALRRAPSAADEERRDRLLGRLGAYFCRREDGPFSTIRLIWYAYRTSYRTGAETKKSQLHYGYACASGRIVDERWFPSNRELARFWGEDPWE